MRAASPCLHRTHRTHGWYPTGEFTSWPLLLSKTQILYFALPAGSSKSCPYFVSRYLGGLGRLSLRLMPWWIGIWHLQLRHTQIIQSVPFGLLAPGVCFSEMPPSPLFYQVDVQPTAGASFNHQVLQGAFWIWESDSLIFGHLALLITFSVILLGNMPWSY